MSKLVICLALWLAGLSVALAQTTDITGRYRVEGRNPTGKEIYRGEVAVAQTVTSTAFCGSSARPAP